MSDLAHHARRLRDIADSLDALSNSTRDLFAPHPDTDVIVRSRHTPRAQLNYAVPELLQLQQRIRRCNADTNIQHGDIVALALDAYLRAHGYPPQPTKPPTGTS